MSGELVNRLLAAHFLFLLSLSFGGAASRQEHIQDKKEEFGKLLSHQPFLATANKSSSNPKDKGNEFKPQEAKRIMKRDTNGDPSKIHRLPAIS